jgi:hypothetical protein
MKYKQKYIPCINSVWSESSAIELRKLVLEWYRSNLTGKKVINQCLGIPILFSHTGGKKLAMGGAIYLHKAELVRVLPAILEHADYCNWGDRKEKDSVMVIGYLNFKCKVKINGINKHLRIAVRMQKDGKLYWNHEINIK